MTNRQHFGPLGHPDDRRRSAMCEGKEAFAIDGLARMVASKMSKRGKVVSPYRCQICGMFHIGTPGMRR